MIDRSSQDRMIPVERPFSPTLSDVWRQARLPGDAETAFGDLADRSLFPVQQKAFASGVLQGRSMLICAPTASGKTLIAQTAMLARLLRRKGRCLYVVPLKALAQQQFKAFRRCFSPFDIKVGLATADHDIPPIYLSRYQILIGTPEKFDALMRAQATWLLSSLQTVVVDEIHTLDDPRRGPVLEILIARIKQHCHDVQFIGLSATLGNTSELADWLRAVCLQDDWRPIPLVQGVYANGAIIDDRGGRRCVGSAGGDDLKDIVMQTLEQGGQVLVFAASRRHAVAAAKALATAVPPHLSAAEQNACRAVVENLRSSGGEITRQCETLHQTVAAGVAFHHAGLLHAQRRIIEEAFLKGTLKVVCATPTLAAGVNLPARRVVLRDVQRYDTEEGPVYIGVNEYKQCAGRAGRPGMDPFGEAVILAKRSGDIPLFMERYIHSPPEPVRSRLSRRRVLKQHILASVAAGFVTDVNTTFEFLRETLMAAQGRHPPLIETISGLFDELLHDGFIEQHGFRFRATSFGRLTSRLYLDCETARLLREGVVRIREGKNFSTPGLLHWVCCCPDMELLPVGKDDWDSIEMFIETCRDELVITPDDDPLKNDFLKSAAAAKTALFLHHWIEETGERRLCDLFRIGPGDVHRHHTAAQWLAYAALMLADLLGQSPLARILHILHKRLQYGVKEELLALVRLPRIGRIRARRLMQHGYADIRTLRNARVEDIAAIKGFGVQSARELIDHLHQNPVLESAETTDELPCHRDLLQPL